MPILEIGKEIRIENYDRRSPGIITEVNNRYILVSYPNEVLKKYYRTKILKAIIDGKRVNLGTNSEQLEEILNDFRFEDADKLYDQERQHVDPKWYNDLRKHYRNKYAAQKKISVELELTKLLQSHDFVRADQYYHSNSQFTNPEFYTSLKKECLEEFEYLQNKENAKSELLWKIENEYQNAQEHWISNASSYIEVTEFHDLLIEHVRKWFRENNYSVPDEEQALAIAQIWDDIQVIARAGSGKTSTIINRAAFLVEHCGINASDILILAFNRNAADEVVERLSGLLKSDVPQAMTFHALAWAIVHPKEDILKDDDNSGWQKSRGVQRLIDDYIRNNEPTIAELMMQYFQHDWDKIVSHGYHLSPEEMLKYRRSLPYLGFDGIYYKSQGEKQIADYLFEHEVPYKYEKDFNWQGRIYKPDFYIPLEHPKIKAIIIEYFGIMGDSEYDAQRQEKKAFWQKKADFIFIELDNSRVNHPYLRNKVGYNLKTYGFSMNRLTDKQIWYLIKDRELDHFSRLVSSFIGRCRNALISPDDIVRRVKDGNTKYSEMVISFLRVAWKLYSHYLESLKLNEQEDFQGLISKAAEQIEEGKYLWDRKNGSGDLSKLKYIFVDEYQDFSPLFYKLLSSIKKINPNIKVFCVGDDWQAINGFAGSDLKYFNDFRHYFPNGRIMSITKNYRSSCNIVELGNQIMEGEGVPSKATNNFIGKIKLANIKEFKPSHEEELQYPDSTVTAAIVRIAYNLINDNQEVAILCRRKNGWPWYNPYGKRFRENLLHTIREAFSEDVRSMIKIVDTVHSYKGMQEDAIIIADAVERSYPLIHPDNVFYEVLGQTLDDVIADERRLFYVGVSRAKSTVYFITDGQTTPFLHNSQLTYIDLNQFKIPPREGKSYLISLEGNTYPHKELLRSFQYSWSPTNRMWSKRLSADSFSVEKLLEEQWVKEASNIKISVMDEFGKMITRKEIQS